MAAIAQKTDLNNKKNKIKRSSKRLKITKAKSNLKNI
jgi:hypothetical protein